MHLRPRLLLPLALTLIALMALACGGGSDKGLSEDGLRNGTYKLDPASITLKDGTYEAPPGGTQQIARASLVKTAMGDLDGKGGKDAAVIVAWNGGGSGTFIDLIPLLNNDGKAEQVGLQLLGDRTKVNSISINNKGIDLDLVVQGPSDGACCPTQPLKTRYVLKDGKLVEAK